MEPEPLYDQNPRPVSTGDWIITILITAIPIIGFIMLFVWAFGGGSNPSKANWAKATIIWFLIVIILYVVLVLFVFNSMIRTGNMPSYF